MEEVFTFFRKRQHESDLNVNFFYPHKVIRNDDNTNLRIFIVFRRKLLFFQPAMKSTALHL